MTLQPNRKETLELPGGRKVEVGVIDHVFREWKGDPLPPTKFNYKPAVELGGVGMFAEIALVRLFKDEGWDAVWASQWPGFHYFDEHPLEDNAHAATVPDHVEETIEKIADANGGKRSGMFDVIAWRDGQFRFTESKRSKRDGVKDNQLGWLAAALDAGFDLDDFALFEWRFEA